MKTKTEEEEVVPGVTSLQLLDWVKQDIAIAHRLLLYVNIEQFLRESGLDVPEKELKKTIEGSRHLLLGILRSPELVVLITEWIAGNMVNQENRETIEKNGL